MLNKAICKLTILSFIFFITPLILPSQEGNDSNPIMPYDPEMVRDNIGAYISVGQNWQSGDIIPTCNSCLFTGGVGGGFTFGAFYDREITRLLYWGIELSYEVQDFEARFIDIQSRPVEINPGEEIFFRLNFDQVLDIQLSTLGVMPNITWRPFQFLTLKTGINFSFPMSSSFVHSEILNDRTVRYQGVIYEVATVEDSPVVQDTEIPGLNSMLYSWNYSLIFPIEIFHHSYLEPAFSMAIPLNNFSSENPGFLINRWRIQIGYRYPLTAPPKQKPEQIPLY